jgi:23S rRNA U2552 (ribose-2'-O)-methylase RlmE/FtsJ
MDYILFQLINIDDDIFKQIKKNGFNASYSKFLCQPQFKNGFNIFIHASKDKMAIVEDPKYKNKNFYYVTNPFEHTIINNSKNKTDISTYSKLYFDINKSKLNILSRAFYKLWEILTIFDLLDNKKLVSAHLAEAPGSFVQALVFFREKFYKKSEYDKDEHYVISIKEEGVPTFKKDFKLEYPRVKLYEQDGGDLTSLKSIDKFIKFSKKANLITADGGFIWNDENYQEQESYKLIIGEIITALKIQEKDGSFILKIFEIYTDISIKIISILCSIYKVVYITKPYTSRPSNSERYLICKKYKGIDDTIIKKLEELLEEITTNEQNNLFLVDILPNYTINTELKNIINLSSIVLSNIQHISINKMIKYIYSNNYYGDIYYKYLEEQQNANDFWTQTFYPIDAKDIKYVKKNIEQLINTSLSNSNNKVLLYNNYIIL